MKPLKIGLMSFAHVHAAGYARLLKDWPGIELLCADPDWPDGPAGEVRGAEFASQLGVDYVDTYDELFAWKPDAVIVCSENTRHRELVVRAAAEGCQVLCEKPLATTVPDGEAMVAACAEAGVFLMVAYPVQFAQQFAQLREAVDAGKLGDLMMVTGTNNGQIPVGLRSWFTDPEFSGGGAMVDHVVHVADLLDALLGGIQAESVKAVSNQILHSDKPQVSAETGGVVVANYPGGLSAAIDCSWSQPDSHPSWGGVTLEVYGTQGNASIAPFAQRVDGYSELTKSPLWLSFGQDLDRSMLETFIGAIRSGNAPQPDGAVGLRTLKIVTAAQESARTGRVVEI